MEKKNIYVVSETLINSKSMYVETFIKCVTEDLEIAKDVLNSLREVKIKLGYDENNFLISNFGWTYKHVYGIIRAEIHFKYLLYSEMACAHRPNLLAPYRK